MTKITRVCQYCSSEMQVRFRVLAIGGGKYCTKKCFQLSQRRRLERTCKNCGKKREFTFSQIAKLGGGKYCSRSCQHQGMKRRVECICKTCGKTREVRPHEAANGEGKYCSLTCQQRGKMNRVTRTCETCGKKHEVHRYRIEAGQGKFCSKRCFLISKTSLLEIIVSQILKEKSINFEFQKEINGYYPDFYLPDYNLILECDGAYWHQDKDRDRKKDEWRLTNGYNIIRLQEKDILLNPEKVLMEALQAYM